jgi:hypothetical protein
MSNNDSVSVETILHHYMAAVINGEPGMGSGSTALDGKHVRHRTGEDYSGVVLGPARIPDFAWVRWEPEGTKSHLGLHRLTDLGEIDD